METRDFSKEKVRKYLKLTDVKQFKSKILSEIEQLAYDQEHHFQLYFQSRLKEEDKEYQEETPFKVINTNLQPISKIVEESVIKNEKVIKKKKRKLKENQIMEN